MIQKEIFSFYDESLVVMQRTSSEEPVSEMKVNKQPNSLREDGVDNSNELAFWMDLGKSLFEERKSKDIEDLIFLDNYFDQDRQSINMT